MRTETSRTTTLTPKLHVSVGDISQFGQGRTREKKGEGYRVLDSLPTLTYATRTEYKLGGKSIGRKCGIGGSSS